MSTLQYTKKQFGRYPIRWEGTGWYVVKDEDGKSVLVKATKEDANTILNNEAAGGYFSEADIDPS